MAPVLPSPILLNSTCMEWATANYTLLDPAAGNLTATCTYVEPFMTGKDKAILALVVVKCIILFIKLVDKIAMHAADHARRKLLKKLRNLPSYHLHRKVEELYTEIVLRQKDPLYEYDRYTSVTQITDRVTKERTLTIVEDMSKEPFAAKEAGQHECGPGAQSPLTPPPPSYPPAYDMQNSPQTSRSPPTNTSHIGNAAPVNDTGLDIGLASQESSAPEIMALPVAAHRWTNHV